MIIKKKILIIEKFGLIELFFLSFFKLKFYRIYYLKRNIKLNPNFLKLLKVYQLDYEKLNNYNCELLIITKKNTEKVLKFFKKQKSYYQYISNNSDNVFFESAFLKNMYNEILSITEIIEFSKLIPNVNKKNFFFYTNKIKLFELLNNKSSKNIYPLIFIKIRNFIFNILIKFLRYIFLILNLLLKPNKKKILSFNKNKGIFFPHKGIHYSNLYLKNQFYDKNINSVFYPTKIIHSSFHYEGNLDKFTHNYYKKNKIIFKKWTLNNFEKFLLISYFFTYKRNKFLKINNEFDFNLIKVLFKYHYHKRILHTKFSQIKFCLVAYGFLFPSELLLVFNQNNILSISHDERIIQSYWGIQSPIKYILAMGRPIIKNSLSNNNSNYILSGPIRLIKFLENKKQLSKLNSYKKKRFSNSKTCLVLDWESEINEYENKQKFANNWKNNYIFYNDIYQVAKKYQNINFLFKGKSNNAFKIRFYQNLFLKLFNLKNVIYISNKDELHTSYNALFICDYLIALHTSLIDEAIFMEKKLMIYDKFNLLDKMNYYTRDILIKSDNDLFKKSFLLFNKPLEMKKLIKKNKQYIFGNLTISKIRKKYNSFTKIFNN